MQGQAGDEGDGIRVAGGTKTGELRVNRACRATEWSTEEGSLAIPSTGKVVVRTSLQVGLAGFWAYELVANRLDAIPK